MLSRYQERLIDEPLQAIGTSLPDALDQRLDALLRRAESVGERVSRRELLAALILNAPEDPEHISQLVRRYRTARVRDAVLEEQELLPAFERVRRPGPRRIRPGATS